MTNTFARVVPLVLIASCASVQADGFQYRLGLIKEHHQKNFQFWPVSGVGLVIRGADGTFRAERAYATAGGQPEVFGAGRALRFHSLAGGEICFEQDVDRYPDREAAMAFGDAVPPPLETVKKEKPIAEAFTTFAGLQNRPVYQPAKGSMLTKITVVEDETHLVETKSYEIDRKKDIENAQHMTFRLCGKAPEITPQTKYLTVAQLVPGQDADATLLFLWAIVPETEGTRAPQLDF